MFGRKWPANVGNSECFSKALSMGFLYTELQNRVMKYKDGQNHPKRKHRICTTLLPMGSYFKSSLLVVVSCLWRFCRRGEQPGRTARNTTVLHVYMPTSTPAKNAGTKWPKINVLSLGITPGLGMLERQNLYLTLPWVSMHQKIRLLGLRWASFIPERTSKRGYSERSSKASPKGFLCTELSKRQIQSKDGQNHP